MIHWVYYSEANFNDSNHLQNLLKNFSSERANSLIDNSIRYATSYSASQLRESQKFTDLLSTVIAYQELHVSIDLLINRRDSSAISQATSWKALSRRNTSKTWTSTLARSSHFYWTKFNKFHFCFNFLLKTWKIE